MLTDFLFIHIFSLFFIDIVVSPFLELADLSSFSKLTLLVESDLILSLDLDFEGSKTADFNLADRGA